MYRLSVCEGTFLPDLSWEQRVRTISEAGFLVDLWGWDDDVASAIGADTSVQISAMPGWIGGSMVHPDGVAAFLEGVNRCLAAAEKLNCRNLAVGTGEINREGKVVHKIAEHPATMWITAYKTLSQMAELAEQHDVVFAVETLNTKVDHAGYPLSQIEDTVRLVEAVDSPRIRILFDIYHAQVEEGNVIQGLRDHFELIGHIHVADVPGRHEPGTGEINYPKVASALKELGYEGVVGLEAFPLADDLEAMNRFREAFA